MKHILIDGKNISKGGGPIKWKGLRSDTVINNALPPTSDTLSNYEKKTC